MTTDSFPHEVFALSDADRDAVPGLRDMFRRFWSRAVAQVSPRVAYDAFFAATPPSAGVSLHPSLDPRLPGWICVPEQAVDAQALLYIHGGVYTMGTAPAYRGLASQIAARTRRTTFILEYPLAPEAALPAAIDLAVAAGGRLRETYDAVRVIGDSAGAGITLATLACTDEVSAAVVFSPWTDLTFSGSSLHERASPEVLLDTNALRRAARGYIGEARGDEPRASPLLDITAVLPPLLIQAGADEILYDDVLRYVQRAHVRGLDVTLQEWSGMHHVFQMNVEQLEAARLALDLAAGFLDRDMRSGQ